METAAHAGAGGATRLPGLDLLRALAITWVMICHAGGFELLPSDYFGWMGVDLFFVLSGFLIGGQLFRTGAERSSADYVRFARRRLLRTVPAYLFMVGLYAVFPALWDRDSLQPVWQFLSFTQNLLIDPTHSNSFSHAWSLCVEEQFYLALPLLIVMFRPRATPARIVGLFAILVLMGMVLRGYLWLHDVAHTPFDIASAPRSARYMKSIYYPTWTRLDDLLAGVGAAMIRAYRPQLWSAMTARANLLLAAGLAGVAGSIVFFKDEIAAFWPAVFGFPLLALSMTALVIAASDRRSLIGRLNAPGAGALAAGAYSLYLSHKMAYRAVIRFTAHAAPAIQSASFVLAVLAALAAGGALYWLVERPFLRLRDRFDRTTLNPAALTNSGALAAPAE